MKVALIMLVLFMLVVYGMGMYGCFPDQVPYVYQKNNLCAQMLPGYEEFMSQLLGDVRTWRAAGL